MNEPEILIELIPIDRIALLNPRARGRKNHREIIDSVESVGLKRPITVSRRKDANGEVRYDLVCGEGRIHVVVGGELPNILVQCKQYLGYPEACKEKLDRIIAAGSGAPPPGQPPAVPPPPPQ
jgi:hypothetical protein